MESKKNIFTSRLKEIFLEFESVVNEINDLHDSNNLCHSIANANNGLSNVSDINISFPNNIRDGDAYQNDNSCPTIDGGPRILPMASTRNISFSDDNRDGDAYRHGNSWSRIDGGLCILPVASTRNIICPNVRDGDAYQNENSWPTIDGGEFIQTNPVSISATACSRDDKSYSNVDENNLVTSDPENNFGDTYIGDGKGYSEGNVSYKVDENNLVTSNPENNFGVTYIGDGNGFGCSKGNVMGFELPTVYGFNEEHLECVLKEASSRNVVNYLYYLSDNYDALDTLDSRMDNDVNIADAQLNNDTLDFKMDNDAGIGDAQNHTSHKEFEFTSNVDADKTIEIGLLGETAVMVMNIVSVDANVTTEPIGTSLSVNAASSIGTTSIVAIRDCDDRNEIGYCSVSEVECADEFIDCETVEITRNRGCDNSQMFVPTSDAGAKLYCCKYCNVRIQKLERHLRNVHKNEKDVKKYLAFPPGTPARRKIIIKIQKEGDFMWNNNGELNGGEYAVRRRPNKKFKKDPWQLIPCPGCLGAYSKSYLSRHWNKECAKQRLVGERGVHQLGRAVESRLHRDASEDLSEIFATFNENENIRHIRFDWLVICYGNDLCLNHSPHYQRGYICGKLRAVGKVLRSSKSISPDLTDMSSLFHVKHCNTVVDAIRSMGKFDHKTKRFGSPGTASTTVTLINTIGELLVIEAMKSDDPEKERDVERFLKVFKKDVKIKILKLVAISRLENKRHQKEIIPTTADVNKFAKYLDSERDACFLQLTREYDYGDWLKLSQLTMLSILIYNRRRAGEMQNLLMKDFENREIVADQCEMLLNEIPNEAKRKIKSRVAVRNKLGKKMVPILLKHNWDECIELLLRYRHDAAIPENNDFLFALPTHLEKIRTTNVCAIMRSFSRLCGAENPSSLRGTYLRKHMASFSSTKNLSDNDISNLADFMGHAEAVHRSYYRINPLTNQVGKISFLLDSALGNDSPSDNGADSDDSEDESDEYESDIESEKATPSNAIRGTAKKNKPKETIKTRKTGISTKRKRNVKPKAVPKSRKKTVTTTEVKKNRNVTQKKTNKKKRKME